MELAPPPVAYAGSTAVEGSALEGCQPVSSLPPAAKATAPTAVFQGVEANAFTPQPLATGFASRGEWQAAAPLSPVAETIAIPSAAAWRKSAA